MGTFIAAFLSAAVVALGATPIVRRFALRIGAIDRPGVGHIHHRPVPYLGGVAIFVAFAAALCVLRVVDPGQDHAQMDGILLGGLIIVLLGAVDDLGPFWSARLPWLADADGRGLRPSVKLLGQIGAAVVLCLYGVVMYGIQNPLTPGTPDWISFGWAAYPLTVFWVVAITNGVNLVDGLDGLAAGISSIAAATLLVVALLAGDMLASALLCAALLGSCVGFLPWNFHPARIFMGDAGALFLGFALGAVSVVGPLKTTTLVALAVPALAIGLPVLDTALAIVRRWGDGRMVGERDHAHVHHRLLALGLSHRDAVLALYVISGWLGISALAVERLNPVFGAIIVLFVVSSVIMAARLAGILPRRHAAQPQPQAQAQERESSVQA